MQLIRGLHNLSEEHRGCALTIGNFDGVHLGHLEILKNLNKAARERHLLSCIMSFEPLPMEYFDRQTAPARLHRIREKWCALQNADVDYFLCARFNHQLAELSADDFINKILLEKLNVKYLLVGDDFRFGKKRCGDFETLQQAGKKHGFEVHNTDSVCYQDERISSTRIRQALMQNQLTHAEKMLGQPYQICGRIAHGDKRGRTIGFPTANIKLHRHATAVHGVYAVHMTGENNLSANGVANIGKRPTVDGQHLQLEVHLFDFDKEIYGQKVCVEFKQKIRDEKRFNSFDELKQQIIKDSKQAKDFFASKTDK
ncbi:MAG: bifunctional riboflavin kinase/FAD synthetase [endosymbiont of Galathealinum brachiosum]|uniref:Riboflavin biosynthesis protein n=1 Tax=endosymbiont of Galathealinum brachiosum TaxID=2200906 RepID=A0A370DCI0_9GAMM|nr:MAG: bifunctional riboflavin kinase/FAD synthetase [endosymbiont of Galathealinum brachiosum]